MNIKMKLYSVFSVMTLIVLIVAGVSSYAAHYLNNSYESLLNGHVENIAAIKDLKYYAADETKYMRGYLLTGREDQLESLKEAKKSTTEQIKMLEQLLSGDSEQLLKKFESAQTNYANLTDQLVVLKQQGNEAAYNEIVSTKCVPIAQELANNAEAMENYERQQLIQARADNAHTVKVVNWTLIIAGVMGVLLGMIIATFVVRMFSRPIKLVADSAKEIAEGNLTIPDIELKSHDELGQMATSFNLMKNKLRELMNVIAGSSEQMAAASQQLFANAEEGINSSSQTAVVVGGISDSATQQRMQVTENKARLDQNASSIANIVAATSQVSQSSERVLSEVEQGNRNVQHTVTQMSVIDNTVQETAASLYKLAEHSQEIAAIVQVIRDIASQTNLLSLNASIEAARAGEHGKGFAVVASEVKKLADYSSQSAGQISTKIEDMIQNMAYTVSKMEEGARQVQSGTAAVQEMGAIFDTVQETIQIVSIQVKEALQASDVLSSAATSIMDAENHIVGMAETIMDNSHTATDASEQQVRMMEEISAAADSLSQLSFELQTEIGKFRI
ncbi:methyl-accepting chemotaxis protein [Paenibacillus sp. SGZ-1009]|uniref:methyl-accepting chemotaxis protein n=1 Tax=Paenibacillus campi TaxID=3106031 RepID=UPI002AFE307E|nr:methyl-accepting chemotaxis protein [Paenibacillus sp. SGZ-1009]